MSVFLRKSIQEAPVHLFLALFAFIVFGCSESGSDNEQLPLAAPTSFQPTPMDQGIRLMWTRVAKAQGIEPTFKVYYSTENDFAARIDSGLNPTPESESSGLLKVDITGLQNGVKYYIWIETYYAGLGKANFVPTNNAVPIPHAEKVENITPIEGEQIIWLTWNESPHASSYEIAYSTTDKAEPSSSDKRKTVFAPNAVLTELENLTPYYIWIRAKNTDLNTPSEFVKYPSTVTPKEAAALPATPYITTVSSGNKRLTVTWNTDPSARIYELTWVDKNLVDKSIEVKPEVGVVSATISGLINQESYIVSVAAKNYSGNAKSSERVGSPEASSISIDFNNYKFSLGTAASDYIYGETLPVSPIFYSGQYFDRLTRTKETAIGNLFTDGAAWFVREKFEEIDFAFLNGGYIDNTITAGPISIGSLLATTLPANREDTIVILSLKGRDVKALFEAAAKVNHPGRGGYFTGTDAFGMVSKEVQYTISYPVLDTGLPDLSLDTKEEIEPYVQGEIKAGTLKIRGEEVLDETVYRIATTSQLAMGLYGYLVFAVNGYNRFDTGVPFWHGVAEYIYDQANITPYTDGRLCIEGGIPLGGSEPQPPYH
ncbi:MAG: 5'-nucleotidase C-terminal domain-containing protein [Deferribacteraceae bacterium]|jgi:hypothetical protein|nr:5'-nucleotidase C-terminal domain-containing protein [Deferribacteraceae bacterium]